MSVDEVTQPDELDAVAAEGISIVVSTRAHHVLLAHALQHFSSAVTGVLLGTQEDGRILVERCVPLFHTAWLSPMMEMAMMLVRLVILVSFKCFGVSCASRNY